LHSFIPSKLARSFSYENNVTIPFSLPHTRKGSSTTMHLTYPPCILSGNEIALFFPTLSLKQVSLALKRFFHVVRAVLSGSPRQTNGGEWLPQKPLHRLSSFAAFFQYEHTKAHRGVS